MEFNLKALIFSLIFATSVAFCSAKIANMDDYWRNKLSSANAVNQANYDPDPAAVATHTNKAIHHAIERYENTTRRSLRSRKFNGQCVATNPIDRCWRCQRNWAENRKQYASCVKGFGRKTTGGSAGEIYVVTDPRDDDLVNPRPGTLRHGVTRDRPLWIIFAHDMNIQLQQELMINSHKTIDGRGAVIHILKKAGLTIQGVTNIIITNIRIHDIVPGQGGMIRDSETHYGVRTRSDGDGISIMTSSNVWIDHVSMSNCADGIIDVVANSTAVTISNSHFTHHNDVMLLGASDSNSGDQVMQVTVAFNHFGKGLVQRMPRARWGFVHVVNNDYTHWLLYAIGGSKNPTILAQGNRFIAPPLQYCKQVTKRDYSPQSIWKNWNWQSEGNLYMNGAFFVDSGSPIRHNFNHADVIQAKPGSYVSRLTRFAGPLRCIVGKPC